jgi:hypothetical protein
MTNIRKSKLLKKNNRRKKKPHKIRTKKGGGESVWPNPRPTSESGLGANKKKIEMSKTNWDKKLGEVLGDIHTKIPDWYIKEKDNKSKSPDWKERANMIAEIMKSQNPPTNQYDLPNVDLNIREYWFEINWPNKNKWPHDRPKELPEGDKTVFIDAWKTQLKVRQDEWDEYLHTYLMSIWENDNTGQLGWWKKYYKPVEGNLVKIADFPEETYETVGGQTPTTDRTSLLDEKIRHGEWLEQANIIAASAYLPQFLTKSVGAVSELTVGNESFGAGRGAQNPTYDSGVNQLNISKYYYNEEEDTQKYQSLSEYIKEDINNDKIFILYMDLIILVSNLHYYGIILGNIDTTTFYRNNGTSDMPMYKIYNKNFLVSLKQDQIANEINCSNAGQIGQIGQLKEDIIKTSCDNLTTFNSKITNKIIRENFFTSIESTEDKGYYSTPLKLWQNIETLMYIDLFSIENLIMTLANDINQDLIQPFKNSLNNFDIRSANSDFDSNQYIDFVDTLTIQVIRYKVSNKGNKLPAYDTAGAGGEASSAAAAILHRQGTALRKRRTRESGTAAAGYKKGGRGDIGFFNEKNEGDMYDTATVSLEQKSLKVKPNNGVPTGYNENNMSKQCFWISIKDWYNLKQKDNYNTVTEIRNAANISGLINGKNDDVILEGDDDINNTIKAFAQTNKLFIRVFYFNRDTNGLNLGQDCVENGLGCKREVYDFGEINEESDNMIIIVAYGVHFELVTQYEEGAFKYDIKVDSHDITDATPKYYNNEGYLVEFDVLDDVTIEQLFKSELGQIKKHLPNEIDEPNLSPDRKNELFNIMNPKFTKLKEDYIKHKDNSIIDQLIIDFEIVLGQYR